MRKRIKGRLRSVKGGPERTSHDLGHARSTRPRTFGFDSLRVARGCACIAPDRKGWRRNAQARSRSPPPLHVLPKADRRRPGPQLRQVAPARRLRARAGRRSTVNLRPRSDEPPIRLRAARRRARRRKTRRAIQPVNDEAAAPGLRPSDKVDRETSESILGGKRIR